MPPNPVYHPITPPIPPYPAYPPLPRLSPPTPIPASTPYPPISPHQVEGPWLEGLINDATDKIKRLRAEEKANPGDGDLPTVGAFITAEQPTPAGTFTLPASAPTLATRAGGEPCPAEAAATTPGSSTVAAIAAGACVAGAIAMLALQQLGRRCCRSGGRPEIKRGSQMPQPPFSA